MKYPKALQQAIDAFKKLPGVGQKSAERYALSVLGWEEKHLQSFAEVIGSLKKSIQHCSQCGCFTERELCNFCANPARNKELLCLVASAKDALVIEASQSFFGLYYVLGGLISPLHGKGPDSIDIEAITAMLNTYPIKEVIVALDSTIEGDATLLYLKKTLSSRPIRLTRLAFGMPMGSSLDYLDGNTLSLALQGRNSC